MADDESAATFAQLYSVGQPSCEGQHKSQDVGADVVVEDLAEIRQPARNARSRLGLSIVSAAR
jgi:hypothetical protein